MLIYRQRLKNIKESFSLMINILFFNVKGNNRNIRFRLHTLTQRIRLVARF